jgi:hypothetical protein
VLVCVGTVVFRKCAGGVFVDVGTVVFVATVVLVEVATVVLVEVAPGWSGLIDRVCRLR